MRLRFAAVCVGTTLMPGQEYIQQSIEACCKAHGSKQACSFPAPALLCETNLQVCPWQGSALGMRARLQTSEPSSWLSWR
eukprot:scaffold11862_cov21-Tisochrysis_lutea.AAC.3